MSKEFAEPRNASLTASTSSGTQVNPDTAAICQTAENKEVKKKTRTYFNFYEEWAKLLEKGDAYFGDSSTDENSKDSGESTMSMAVKQQQEEEPKAKPVHGQNSVGANLLNSQKKNSAKNTFATPQSKLSKPLDEDKENEDKKNVELKIKDFFKQITVIDKTYIILNVLGKGGSSTVYDCFNPQTKTACAIKCVSLNCDKEQEKSFINEVKTLVKLQGCHRIIKLYAYQILTDKKRLFVVLEKGGKDLAIILRELVNSSTHMPLYMVIYYWMEMLYAVKEIHDRGVIHSDLKPANFLEVNGRIKLIDFGIASSVQSDMTSVIKNVSLGTFSYISPEALSNDSSTNDDSPNYGKQKFKISFKSDVWSLGCILYQLIYRKTPFQHIVQPLQKFVAISNPDHKINYPPVDWVPERIIKTMQDCLQYDMRSRPSVDDLISQYEAIYK